MLSKVVVQVSDAVFVIADSLANFVVLLIQSGVHFICGTSLVLHNIKHFAKTLVGSNNSVNSR